MKERPVEGFYRPSQQWKTLYFADLSCKFHFENQILEKSCRAQITDQTLIAPSDFWRSLDLPLINCEIELDLSWSKNCVLFEILRTAAAAEDNPRETTATTLGNISNK